MRKPKEKKLGDCFEASLKYILSLSEQESEILGEIKLVHAEVMGQGPLEGITFGHAFVTVGDLVIDKSNGRDVRIPKSFYYSLGKIFEIGTYGPWDLVTRSGL